MTERTALLVMDVQTAIVAGAPSSMLRAVRVALDGAHAAGIPVVYIQVLFRPGRAGVSPRNKKLTRLHEMLTEGAPGLDILPAVAPVPDDFVLTKHRLSSFAGSGLDVLLRSLDVTHLVLTGASTSTAVLSTALAAADLDFELTVLSDACFNGSGVALHELLLTELFPTIADVMTADQWVANGTRRGDEFSGTEFDESSFTRVEFRDCRLSGARFTRGALAQALAGAVIDSPQVYPVALGLLADYRAAGASSGVGRAWTGRRCHVSRHPGEQNSTVLPR